MNKDEAQPNALHERAKKIIKLGLLAHNPTANKDALRVTVLNDIDDRWINVSIFYYEVPLTTAFFNCAYLDELPFDDSVRKKIQLLNDARKKWGLEPDPEVDYILTDIESVETLWRDTHEH